MLGDGTAVTPNGICTGQRHRIDAAANAGLVLGALPHQVGPLSAWIGPYHQKVMGGGESLVADTGRDEHGVAGADGQRRSILATESDFGLSRRDPQDLMRGRVVVVKRKDAVPPASTPAVTTEKRFEGCGRIGRLGIDSARIDDERQGIVGDVAVIGEEDYLATQ